MTNRTDESDLKQLYEELRGSEASLVEKYGKRVDHFERLRPWSVGIGLVGATIVAVTRLFPLTTANVIITCIGMLLTLIFGVLTGLFDFRKLEISQDARKALALADRSYAASQRRDQEISDLRAGLAAKEKRLAAGSIIRDMMMSGLRANLPTMQALHFALAGARLQIAAAADFDGDEFWAISVFRHDPKTDRMTRIAVVWNADPTPADDARAWRRGEGFTGTAWQSEKPLIVSDMTKEANANLYSANPDQLTVIDRERYLSAAS